MGVRDIVSRLDKEDSLVSKVRDKTKALADYGSEGVDQGLGTGQGQTVINNN